MACAMDDRQEKRKLGKAIYDAKEEAKSIFEVLVERAALVTPTEFNQTDSDGEHGMESMGNTPHTGLRDDFVKVRRSPGRHAKRFWGLLDGGLYG